MSVGPMKTPNRRWRARRAKSLFLAFCATAALTARSAEAAPITTNTALPVSEGETILRFQAVASSSSGDAAGVEQEIDAFEMRTILGYGLTPRLALFAVVPVVRMNGHRGATKSDEFGFGDSQAFARYEILRRDRIAQTFRAAPYFGLGLPTGETGRTGDGSVDAFGGMIATFATFERQLDAEIRFDANGEADGFERGDAVHLNASLQQRLGSFAGEASGAWYGVMEISAMQSEEDRVDGAKDADSGGFQFFATPGIQYVTHRWIADAAVRIPVVRDMNGGASAPDTAIFLGFRANF